MRRRVTALRERVEHGAAAVYALIMIPVLLIFAALAVDVANWYVELQRLQKTVDAAALAGVPYLPEQFGQAQAEATTLVNRNGFTPGPGELQITTGDRPSQLKVTLSSTVDNGLAALAGLPFTTLTRTATADFTAPAPMGSPCNTLGNEPPGNSVAGPVSAKPTSPFPNCPGPTESANFWSTVLGPEQSKLQGDQFMTRRCSTSLTDNCSANTPPNDDFREKNGARGYYSIVRIEPSAVGSPVTVQLYDPAWVNNGGTCAGLPNNGHANGMNPYAPDARDGNGGIDRGDDGRYDDERTPWCPGDQDANSSGDGNGGSGRVDTSFALLLPNDTLDPSASGVVSTQCVKQYRGYQNPPAFAALDEDSDDYNENLAAVMHQWTTLCTFTPSVAGDYYLQFRTNVALGGAASTNTNGNDPGIYTGNAAVYTQTGDNPSVRGRGNNNFAVRAFVGSPDSPQLSRGTQISVAGYERFPIFQNAPGGEPLLNPVFNLIRVLPGAAGQNIRFTFFDVAEGTSSGSVAILPPVDVTGSLSGFSTARNCSASGPVNRTNDVDCTIPISSSANNGRIQELRVPIPDDYGCDFTDPSGCWFRVRIGWGSGSVNDTTTWTAVVDGDPVRLVQ